MENKTDYFRMDLWYTEYSSCPHKEVIKMRQKANPNFAIAFLLSFVASPLLMCLCVGVFLILSQLNLALGIFAGLLVLAGIGWVWFRYAKRTEIQDTTFKRLLPIVAAFTYYMLLWIISFFLNNYMYGFSSVFMVLAFPFSPVFFPFMMLRFYIGFPITVAILYFVIIVACLAGAPVAGKKTKRDRKAIAYLLLFVLMGSTMGFQYYERSYHVVLAGDNSVEEVKSIYCYLPFASNSRLEPFSETVELTIGHNHPRIATDTPALPLSVMLIETVFTNTSGIVWGDYSQYQHFGNPQIAYKRLIDGEVDIAFGVYPDVEVIETAQVQGVELSITPIALLPVVFIVNAGNPVTSLSFEKIQSIYAGEITNWSDAGGNPEKIRAFAPHSGSAIFSDNLLPHSSSIVMAELKPGLYSPAEYRNYTSAIGYIYSCGKYNDNVKVLALNGVFPTSENVRSGSYPYAESIYALTTSKSSASASELISWLLGGQGQRFVKEYGYVA